MKNYIYICGKMDENQNENNMQINNESKTESQEGSVTEQSKNSDVASNPSLQEQSLDETTKPNESVISQPSSHRSFISMILSFFKRSNK